MEPMKLNARVRTRIGKRTKALRREGVLPGVMYGAGIEAVPIEMDGREASRLLDRASRSTLIELGLDGENYTVLVRDVQRDVIRRDYMHVDFLNVAMDVRIRAEVPIELVGSPPAAKEAGVVLVTGVSEVEVEALPNDLMDRITVDLGGLVEIDDSITVADLYLGENVEVLTDADELVARVIYQAEEIIEEPEVEEELEELPEELEAELEEGEEERGAADEEREGKG